MAKQQHCAFPVEEESPSACDVKDLDCGSTVCLDVATGKFKSQESADEGAVVCSSAILLESKFEMFFYQAAVVSLILSLFS
jgi:hypothetical protein